MNGTRASAAYQDALWRAYVAQDPDLRKLEARKRNIARRRTIQIYTRRSRARFIRRLISKACEIVAAAIIGLFFVAVFMFLLFCI